MANQATIDRGSRKKLKPPQKCITAWPDGLFVPPGGIG